MFRLTCHVVFLCAHLHLSFVHILDYGCAVHIITGGIYRCRYQT